MANTLPMVDIILILVFLFLNGFFVAAEFSFVTVRRTRIEELVEKGSKRAKYTLQIIDDLNTFINSAQVGITFASIGLGWIAEEFFSQVFEDFLILLGVYHFIENTIGTNTLLNIITVLSLVFITTIHVIIGENLPKFSSIEYSEGIALFISPIMVYFTKAISPVLSLLKWFTALSLRPLGVTPGPMHIPVLSEDEIKKIIATSQSQGILETDEKELLYKVFELADHDARDIMTPRPLVKAIPITISYDEVVEIAKETGFSRLPVYDGEFDNIVGILHVKDLINYWDRPDEFDVTEVMRKPLIVPETKSLYGLLQRIKQEKMQIAVVIDEFGVVSGIVTLEDIIEELFGPIVDEFDTLEEEEIKETPEGYIVKGEVHIEEINKALGTKLEANGVISIGGFVTEHLDHIPKVGEKLVLNGWEYEVLEMDKNRVVRVRINPLPEEDNPEEGNQIQEVKKDT